VKLRNAGQLLMYNTFNTMTTATTTTVLPLQPFYIPLDFVWDNLGELAPERYKKA